MSTIWLGDVEGLGTVYLADPVCDDVNVTLSLELYVVTFYSEYYGTSQGGLFFPFPFLVCNLISPSGRKKLKQVEAEIQRLISIRHPNHTSVFAVKLTGSYSSSYRYATSDADGHGKGTTRRHGHGGPPQLMVLSEQAAPLTLYDVLQDCECFREDRARVGFFLSFWMYGLMLGTLIQDYLAQILSGLNAIHAEDVIHRGIVLLSSEPFTTSH